MDRRMRIVTELPLSELWNDDADLPEAQCRDYIGVEKIKALLRRGPVWFVVADVGARLKWINLSECFDFWRYEAKHIARPEERVELTQYQDGYAYFARQWAANLSAPIIVLEKIH